MRIEEKRKTELPQQPKMLSIPQRQGRIGLSCWSCTWHKFHWLKYSSFSVRKLMKNVCYFSRIFHQKSMWKIQNIFRSFSPPGENFEIKQEMSEKVLIFSHTFLVENVVKNNRHFASNFSLKNVNISTSESNGHHW